MEEKKKEFEEQMEKAIKTHKKLVNSKSMKNPDIDSLPKSNADSGKKVIAGGADLANEVIKKMEEQRITKSIEDRLAQSFEKKLKE
jgi:hypothetical protein